MSTEDFTRLIFEPLTNRWYLKLEGSVWNIATPIDAATLGGYFPLEVELGEGMLSSMPVGRVRLKNVLSGSVKLTFHPQVGEGELSEARNFSVARVATGSAFFTAGYYPDGWVSRTSELQYANISSLGIRAYIPESKALSHKKLKIAVNGRRQKEVLLERDSLSEITIAIPPESRSSGEIDLVASYAEIIRGIEDSRELGFVLVSINKDNTNWEALG